MAIPASVSTGTAREGGKGIASEENNVRPAGRDLKIKPDDKQSGRIAIIGLDYLRRVLRDAEGPRRSRRFMRDHQCAHWWQGLSARAGSPQPPQTPPPIRRRSRRRKTAADVKIAPPLPQEKVARPEEPRPAGLGNNFVNMPRKNICLTPP